MNKIENQMLDLLLKLKDKTSLVGVKAEFEAEGTRIEELYRLIDIARKAGVKVALKVGGCEAVKDLMEAKQIGVDALIAPMIESTYALSKYIYSIERVFHDDEKNSTQFYFNVETINAFNIVSDLVNIAKSSILDGIVFGRVDFTGSMGLGRENIHDDKITKMVNKVGSLCKHNELDFVVGGAISSDSLPTLRNIETNFLTKFETRKIVFHRDALVSDNIQESLIDAVHFEMLWLTNKRDYYNNITLEDVARIDMLNQRLKILKN